MDYISRLPASIADSRANPGPIQGLISRPITAPVHTRFLDPHDLHAVVELEREKWDADQAASPAELLNRIERHPDLCLGAFSSSTGELLATLFLKRVADDFHHAVRTWHDCTQLPEPGRSSSLFGVSLSSRDKAGAEALFAFAWPYALKRGWRHVYLGSPVPGLRDWRKANPEGNPEDYARAERGGLPLDPQLRYYHTRGFDDIVAVKPGYFPHERSLDYGVLLRHTVPLSALAPLWRTLPFGVVQGVTRAVRSLA
ncbi:MAG TPA: hypothetical protein VF472_04400 [Burkholderiaceae bacterium]